MAIKLVRKHVEEISNTPVKLNDNLFIKVRDLSKETEMSIEELVNYFVEEAIKQVEFVDDKVKEEKVESTKTHLPVIPSEDDEPDCNYSYIEKKDYESYLADSLEKAFGSDWNVGGIIKNAVTQNLKSKLHTNSVSKIKEMYEEDPQKVESLIDKAIEQRLSKINKKKVIVSETSQNGFNKWFNKKLEENFDAKQHRQIRARIMSSLKTGLKCKNVGEIYDAYDKKPDVVKRYVLHYIDLAKSGNKAGGNVSLIAIKGVDINSPIKKVVTPIEKNVIVLPNTDDRTKMINKLKFAAKQKNSNFNFNTSLSNVYKKMKVVYGYNVNEEKKRYYNTYTIHAKSAIEVVKSFDDLWNIFWNLLQNEADIDYSKIA